MGNAQGPKVYEARVGFTPSLIAGVVLLLGLTAAWVWMGTDPVMWEDPWGWAMIVVPILLFGSFGTLLLVNALRRAVTLRVDQDGIWLGRPAGLITVHGFWWQTPPLTVPWRDIEAVTVYTQRSDAGSGSWTCLGLEMRAESSVAPKGAGFLRRLRDLLGPDREPGTMHISRHVFGWQVDIKALRSAVRQHARAVTVTDHRWRPDR
jgi:hypothetical protein